MRSRPPTRRTALAWLTAAPAAAAVVDRSTVLPSDSKRFLDAATENPFIRLTDPAYSSHLPPSSARPFLQRGNALLYTSDRGGSWQAYRMDLKSGQSRQLSKCEALNPEGVALSPDERTLYLIDGDELKQITVGSQRERVMDRREAAWKFGDTLAVSEDGSGVALVDTKDEYSRLRLLPARSGTPVNLLQGTGGIWDVAFRPKTTSLSFRRTDGTLWLLGRGQQPQQLKSPPGACGPAVWSADGQSLLYLHFPPQGQNTIREFVPESGVERLVSVTSQFVQFARNGDASVFAGLSASKASPYVLLLVRKARREFTLCEHRAKEPRREHILFSPNSQRVFFETDRFGKPVLFSMLVDKLVDNTDPDQ